MHSLQNIPLEKLRDRYGLTSQQINLLFKNKVLTESFEEKTKSLGIVKEFLLFTDQLNDAGIWFIPLRGPILSYRLYNDATSRYYGDLDFLIEVSAIYKVTGILKSMGFRAETTEWPVRKRMQKMIVNHTNELSFFHHGEQLIIELHWRLFRTPALSYSRLEELVNQNQKILKFANRSFSVLSEELELLFLIIHGGTHWWRRLKWLLDVDLFLNKHTIDKDRFRELVAELKADRFVALCNTFLLKYFPGDQVLPCMVPAKPFMIRFSEKRIASDEDIVHDFFKRSIQTVWFSLISYPGIKFKIHIIRNYLFVTEYYGKNSFFSSMPLFYLYGTLRLAAHRLK